jgi:hypothetical protein
MNVQSLPKQKTPPLSFGYNEGTPAAQFSGGSQRQMWHHQALGRIGFHRDVRGNSFTLDSGFWQSGLQLPARYAIPAGRSASPVWVPAAAGIKKQPALDNWRGDWKISFAKMTV